MPLYKHIFFKQNIQILASNPHTFISCCMYYSLVLQFYWTICINVTRGYLRAAARARVQCARVYVAHVYCWLDLLKAAKPKVLYASKYNVMIGKLFLFMYGCVV